MDLVFTYNKEKDVWCLLNKGKNSQNSKNPTKQYEQLIADYGDNPTIDEASTFVSQYILKENISVSTAVTEFQRDWDMVSLKFQKRAEFIFSVTLPGTIQVYLTINSRCPYSISENFFYVSLQSDSARRTVMHELWHFYTWYGVGIDQEERLGKQKYNDMKESLTVLLNVECRDLLPKGVVDTGYPQHQEMRDEILRFWSRNQNIKDLWEHLGNY